MEQLIAHLAGDYLLQNDWMAQNKKKRTLNGELACITHCLLYAICFIGFADIFQLAAIYIFHYLIDRFYFVKNYMEIAGQDDFAKPPFAPWSQIMVDNTFHLLINCAILNVGGS